jgi:hypothetical protein
MTYPVFANSCSMVASPEIARISFGEAVGENQSSVHTVIVVQLNLIPQLIEGLQKCLDQCVANSNIVLP